MTPFNARQTQRGNSGIWMFMVLCFFPFKHMVFTSTFASTMVHTHQHKRVSVSISCDSMNRIAFANDRISQVFGDEEAYTMQVDENGGQIFLKPTEANGEKPIALTVTTENGVVQDLELLPKKMSTATIILKGEKSSHTQSSHDSPHMASTSHLAGLSHPSVHPASFVGASAGAASGAASGGYGGGYGGSHGGLSDPALVLIQVIKNAALHMMSQGSGDAQRDEDKPPTPLAVPLAVEGLKSESLCLIKSLGFAISVYRLTNTSKETQELLETTFYTQHLHSAKKMTLENPLAISIVQRILEPNASTLVFIVRRL